LARTISSGGIRAVLEGFRGDQRRTFENAYCATYHAFAPLIDELYDEVRSGNEIVSIRLAARRLHHSPMATIDGSRMWTVGRQIRDRRMGIDAPIDPLTAGIFCGAMVAQIDCLDAVGHPWSEIANE